MRRHWIDEGPPSLPRPLDTWIAMPVPQLLAYLQHSEPETAPHRIEAALVLATVHTRPGGGPFSPDDRRVMRQAMLHDPQPAVRHACAYSLGVQFANRLMPAEERAALDWVARYDTDVTVADAAGYFLARQRAYEFQKAVEGDRMAWVRGDVTREELPPQPEEAPNRINSLSENAYRQLEEAAGEFDPGPGYDGEELDR
jgi:hypothetical protein